MKTNNPSLLIKQNKIMFSATPFSYGGTEQKEFIWNTHIYGKISVKKPLKNFAKKADSYDLENLNINGVYTSYISLYCVPVEENIDMRSNTEIKLYLTDLELEQNEICIDIMPSELNATTFYSTDFSNELANTNLVKYNPKTGNSKGKKTKFKIYLHEELPSVSDEKMGEKNGRIVLYSGIYTTLGSLIIDFTSVTNNRELWDWKDLSTKITERIHSKYKTVNKMENETDTNITDFETDDIQSNSKSQNKMIFSSKPFSQGGAEQKEFIANTPIYGRIVLEKPLKSYCENPSTKMSNVPIGYARQFCVMPTSLNDAYDVVYDEIFSMNYLIYLTFADLENCYIDFDVMPSNEDATTIYDDWTAFYWSFANPDLELGKKSHFSIKVYSEYNQSNAKIIELKSRGEIFIDYSDSTAASQKKWYQQCKQASKNAEEKYKRTNM